MSAAHCVFFFEQMTNVQVIGQKTGFYTEIVCMGLHGWDNDGDHRTYTVSV